MTNKPNSNSSACDALSEILLRSLTKDPELAAKQRRLLQKLADASNSEPPDSEPPPQGPTQPEVQP